MKLLFDQNLSPRLVPLLAVEFPGSQHVRDAGMAAAQVYQTLRTNRLTEVSGSGEFGEAYPGYSYQFASEEYCSNGLLQVEIVVNRRGLGKPVDTLRIWVYNPDARSGLGQPTFR